MTTHLEDIQYDDYLASLHESYVEALENFARSKNLEELRLNLAKMNRSIDGLHARGGNEELAKALQEVATLNTLYKEIIDSKRAGRRQFIIGAILAIAGLILSGISLI